MHYKTCVSIAEKTPKKLDSVLNKAIKKSDYAELRLDFLKPTQVQTKDPRNFSVFSHCKGYELCFV